MGVGVREVERGGVAGVCRVERDMARRRYSGWVGGSDGGGERGACAWGVRTQACCFGISSNNY